LVCKEFIASRVDGDGVLVLSEFAGAAVELGEALATNPFSHRSMDKVILVALNLPEDERRRRMGALRQAVSENDVRQWGPGTLQIAPAPSRVAAE
ncbi:MAG: trehalose-6-phosphate synthase, partial [Pseudomonadota bacterium]